jgi:hypothetical protein
LGKDGWNPDNPHYRYSLAVHPHHVDAWKNYAGLSGGGMTRADTSRVERKKREDIVSEDSSEDGSSSSDSGPPEIVGQSSQIEDGGEETKVDGKEPNSDGKPRSSKKITSKTTGDLPELHIPARTQTKNQMSKKQRAQPAESGMQHPTEPYYPGYPPPMMPHSAYYDPRFYRYPPPMHPPYYDPYYHGYSHYGGYNDPHMNHGQQPPGYAGADWQKQAWPNPQNPNVAHGANPMQSSTQPMGNGVPEPPAKAKKKKNRRGKHKPKNKAKDVTGEIDTEPKSNEG